MLTHLCVARSFPELEAAFPLSPALLPEIPLDFLFGVRSFPSIAFPSGSKFVGAMLGFYRDVHYNRRKKI